jgi:tRNA (guanosine-2'-O-)-methyltransferase
MKITAERKQRFQGVVSRRQKDLTVILENVHDPHNIGAVLRSCDSVGIREIFVLYTEPELQKLDKLEMGRRTSSGARKWIDVHFYTDPGPCFAHVRRNYETILATHLNAEAKNVYDLDLTRSIALMFGNEHDGLSEEALMHADANFLIPQMGMVKSLNISVACAVTLYEGLRQRREAGLYGAGNRMTEAEQSELLAEYLHRHEHRLSGKNVHRKND